MVAYLRPRTLGEALDLRATRPLMVMAGGTDVYPARTSRLGWGQTAHADVLDISAITGLRGIAPTDTGWRIGALTTWTDLIRADLPPQFDGLKAAAREIGATQIQNRGTLAGNICTASPAGDGIPCLLTLNASVELASKTGGRTIALADFVDAYRHTVLRPDEIVTGIRIPGGAGHSRFLKLGARHYLVISIAMVAGYLEADAGGTLVEARIAVGACSAVAQRLPALEADLHGLTLAQARTLAITPDHITGLQPIDDIRASGAYRAHAAQALIGDLLASFAAPIERAA